MARPVFILCCNGKSQDRNTNFLSVFEILEGYKLALMDIRPGVKVSTEQLVKVAAVPQEGQSQADIRFFVIATWMKTDEESKDDLFAHELAISSPGEAEKVIASAAFKFDKQFHRFIIELSKLTPWPQSGICEIESRIKKEGTSDWMLQRFPIPIEVRKIGAGEESD